MVILQGNPRVPLISLGVTQARLAYLNMVNRVCEMCTSSPPAPAVVYCDADRCFLCATCDEEVHQANRLAQRHIRRPAASVNPEQLFDSSDVLVPDVSDHTIHNHDDSDLSYIEKEPKDLGYTDFDEFEGVVFAKMPALTSADADSSFFSVVPSSSLKDFETDELGWGSDVPSDFEHVVPDIEALSLPFKQPGKKAAGKDANLSESLLDMDAEVPVVRAESSSHETRASMSDSTEVPSMSELTSPTVDSGVEELSETEKSAGEEESSEASEAKSAEQRRQLRKEALARFRSKRANRSFEKRIRYNCRKMLADSRPRVKGRFVRKADMALYRRYGAEYREHLNDSVSTISSVPKNLLISL